MIRINPNVYLIGALLLLVLPLDWLAAALSAAVFHELCHILTLYLFGGKITGMIIRSDGCILETGRMGEWGRFFSILAGPAGSFVLLCMVHIAPKTAICGFFHGLYNLIPVLPLDGGRLLELLLLRYFPLQLKKIMTVVSTVVYFFVIFLSVMISVKFAVGPEPLLIALIWSIMTLCRKIPCKPSEIGVQ